MDVLDGGQVPSDTDKALGNPSGDDVIFLVGARRAQRSKDIDDEAPLSSNT